MTHALLPLIFVDGYNKLTSPATLEKYIEIPEHGNKQFSMERQVLEFYVTYTVVFWQRSNKESHEELPGMRNQKSKESREVALATFANKGGVTKTDHIQGYNPSEDFAKLVIKKKGGYSMGLGPCLCAGNTQGRLALGTEYEIFYFKRAGN